MTQVVHTQDKENRRVMNEIERWFRGVYKTDSKLIGYCILRPELYGNLAQVREQLLSLITESGKQIVVNLDQVRIQEASGTTYPAVIMGRDNMVLLISSNMNLFKLKGWGNPFIKGIDPETHKEYRTLTLPIPSTQDTDLFPTFIVFPNNFDTIYNMEKDLFGENIVPRDPKHLKKYRSKYRM